MSTVTLKNSKIVHAVANTAMSDMKGNTLCNRLYSLDDYGNGPIPNINPKVTCKICIRHMARSVADGEPGFRKLLATALNMYDLTSMKFSIRDIRPGMYVKWFEMKAKCNGRIEHVDRESNSLRIRGIDGNMYDSYLTDIVEISLTPPNIKNLGIYDGREKSLDWDPMALKRIVVMRKDYLYLNMPQSIERRLSDEGFKIEDIINIESGNMESWEPSGFVVVWVKFRLFQR